MTSLAVVISCYDSGHFLEGRVSSALNDQGGGSTGCSSLTMPDPSLASTRLGRLRLVTRMETVVRGISSRQIAVRRCRDFQLPTRTCPAPGEPRPPQRRTAAPAPRRPPPGCGARPSGRCTRQISSSATRRTFSSGLSSATHPSYTTRSYGKYSHTYKNRSQHMHTYFDPHSGLPKPDVPVGRAPRAQFRRADPG